MGLYAAVHVQNGDLDGVTDLAAEWLRERGAGPARSVRDEEPFLGPLPGASDLALAADPPGWVRIHHDLDDPAPLAAFLSGRLGCRVIAATAHSGVLECHVEVHEDGARRRLIAHEDGLIQEGEPFPFEEALDIVESEFNAGSFGQDELERFCGALGLEVLDQAEQYDGPWTLLHVPAPARARSWLGRLLGGRRAS